jgi:uncharacterized membrane protein
MPPAAPVASTPPVPDKLQADSAEEFTEGLRASRTRLATLMIGAGIMHFVAPNFYRRIVPSWVPASAEAVVLWSGVAEIVSGVLVAVPSTKRLGAWLSLLTLVVVYPANIQMALDAGKPKDLQTAAVWLRLPMQLPMWKLAFQHTK